MADRLTLAEKLEIDGDTVIIANHIVFSGRAPLIKGPYDFHLFPLESFKSQYGPDTVITIDTSATLRGVDGVNGVNGTNGKTGANGSNGARGSCPANKNGGSGQPGTDGAAGANGTAGTNGSNGKDAGHQTLPMANADVGVFYIIALGAHGGNGGHGGHGGAGGWGGSGGHGGPGAGCKCDEGGNGNGGNGGASGGGGASGSGGKGGDAGNGGNAGNIVMNLPFWYHIGEMTFKTGGGGLVMQESAVMPDMLVRRVGRELEEKLPIAQVVSEAVTEIPAHPQAAAPQESQVTVACRGFVVETVGRGKPGIYTTRQGRAAERTQASNLVQRIKIKTAPSGSGSHFIGRARSITRPAAP